MKRVGLATFFLFVTLLACGFGQHFLSETTEELCARADTLDTLACAENWLSACTFSQEWQQRWEQQHRILYFFIDHRALEPLEESVALLPHLCREKNAPALLVQTDLLRMRAAQLLQSEELRWNNIF